jgi:6-phosphogluconolactonase
VIKDLSRRDFIALGGAGLISAAATALRLSAQTPQFYAFVGNYTDGLGTPDQTGLGTNGGVQVFAVNMDGGSLELLSSIGPLINVSHLVVHPNGRFLYVNDQRRNYKGGGPVHSFAINPDKSLTHLGAQPTMGSFPTYIAIDKAGTRVAIADSGAFLPVERVVRNSSGELEIVNTYDAAAIALFPIGPDGALEPASDALALPDGHGPGRHQESPHAHSVNFDVTGRWLLICDKGGDRLLVYGTEPGRRTLAAPKIFPTTPGLGPRHSAFHPKLPYFYITNENSAPPSISGFHLDSDTGEVRFIDTIHTDSTNYQGEPSDIRMHPSGNFVYAAVRGPGTNVGGPGSNVAAFRIDQATGKVTHIQNVPCQGSNPRGINLDPLGKYLFIANTDTHNVVTYAVDQDTGKLTYHGVQIPCRRPTDLQVVML